MWQEHLKKTFQENKQNDFKTNVQLASRTYKGKGIYQNVINKIQSKDAPPLFDEEFHYYDIKKNQAHRYTGPNTRLLTRLSLEKSGDPETRRKYKPVDITDMISKNHDIDYYNASLEPDLEKAQVLRRKADERMINEMKKHPNSSKLIEWIMRSKNIFEDNSTQLAKKILKEDKLFSKKEKEGEGNARKIVSSVLHNKTIKL